MSSHRKLRDRNDYTKERKPSERRLDALARLLTRNSECVTVSIIDGKFHIAANEFSSEEFHTVQQQQYAFINIAMIYF